MNLNHQLNPIYQPQGVSLADMLNLSHEVPKRGRDFGTPAVEARIAKMQALAKVSQKEKTNARYIEAFAGSPRTATEIALILHVSKQGVLQQIRKFVDRGDVVQSHAPYEARERKWEWVTK